MKSSITKIFLTGILCMTLLQLLGCFSSQKVPKRNLAIAAVMKPFDAIIVPGIPFKNNKWDTVMKGRVIWAYVLYKNGYTKNIIFSGAAVYSPYYESKVMGLYAQQLGIPKEHIFYETKARHTTENIYYSYLMAKQLGFKTLALATDPFQSSLMRRFTRRRFESPVLHLPFVIDTLSQYNYLNPNIDPTSAKADNFISIKEQESFWHRLMGTFGKGIDWSQYKNGKVNRL